MDRHIKIAILIGCAAATLFFSALTVATVGLPIEAGALLVHADQTLDSIQAAVKDAQDSLDDLYPDIKADAASSAVTSRSTAELVTDLHAQLTGGTDSLVQKQTGILPEAEQTITSVNISIQSLQNDLHTVLLSADSTLRPLQATLVHIDALTKQVNDDVASAKSQSPAIDRPAEPVARRSRQAPGRSQHSENAGARREGDRSYLRDGRID